MIGMIVAILRGLLCGKTNCLDIQMEWHRLHDFDPERNLVYAWICSNVCIAEMLEQLAQEEGYDTVVNRNVNYEKSGMP